MSQRGGVAWTIEGESFLPLAQRATHWLALHLADLYTHTVSAAAAANHARDVLDEAYRRAVREHGIRMQQMADSGADRADLTTHIGTARDDLAELWRRAEAAAQPGWDQP